MARGTNPERPFDRGRIAVLGRGFGGYLALRAMQLQAATFRCGIAVDAPPDPQSWWREQVNTDAALPAATVRPAETDDKAPTVIDQAEALASPVLLLVEPGRSPAIDAATAELRARLSGLGRAPELVELEPASEAPRPASRATFYRRIGDFLDRQFSEGTAKIIPQKDPR